MFGLLKRKAKDEPVDDVEEFVADLKSDTPLYDALFQEASPEVRAILRRRIQASAGATERCAALPGSGAPVPADPTSQGQTVAAANAGDGPAHQSLPGGDE